MKGILNEWSKAILDDQFWWFDTKEHNLRREIEKFVAGGFAIGKNRFAAKYCSGGLFVEEDKSSTMNDSWL